MDGQESFLQMSRGLSWRWTDSVEVYDYILLQEESRILGDQHCTENSSDPPLYNESTQAKGLYGSFLPSRPGILLSLCPFHTPKPQTLQINIGIFHLLLGGLWYYIQITQFAGTDPNYKTFILNAKYPLISAVINVMSGTLAIITEKKRLRSLRSGKLLSDYLFIYTIFYIFVSWTVLKWNHKAVFYSN
ncbi:uncharacterized protein [Notamacropus eugenii]|uniref:uncharacterized protein isoform X2 n=1 Tax=Notamacropus eugenii TaxID=9315 RepID=UPI003B673F8C